MTLPASVRASDTLALSDSQLGVHARARGAGESVSGQNGFLSACQSSANIEWGNGWNPNSAPCLHLNRRMVPTGTATKKPNPVIR